MVVEDGCVVGSFGFIAFWFVSCLLVCKLPFGAWLYCSKDDSYRLGIHLVPKRVRKEIMLRECCPL